MPILCIFNPRIRRIASLFSVTHWRWMEAHRMERAKGTVNGNFRPNLMPLRPLFQESRYAKLACKQPLTALPILAIRSTTPRRPRSKLHRLHYFPVSCILPFVALLRRYWDTDRDSQCRDLEIKCRPLRIVRSADQNPEAQRRV